MPVTETMRDYYAARAKEYDAVYTKPERQTDLRIIEQWLPILLSGKKVLEIACGTGYWTQFYASAAKAVTATDAAQETLDIAKNREGTDKVSFSIADAYALPKELGTFDAAFAGFWLSHVPHNRLRSFLDGLHARLAPRSTVVLIDNIYVEGSSTPISDRDAEGNTYQIRKLTNGENHRVLKNFPSENDLAHMIEEIGAAPHYRNFNYFWGFSYQTPSP
jgi:demethylmenaquinone methyltransferase/2-methoxy-6-polyprenyl-1,4-benzoquinol methylase